MQLNNFVQQSVMNLADAFLFGYLLIFTLTDSKIEKHEKSITFQWAFLWLSRVLNDEWMSKLNSLAQGDGHDVNLADTDMAAGPLNGKGIIIKTTTR